MDNFWFKSLNRLTVSTNLKAAYQQVFKPGAPGGQHPPPGEEHTKASGEARDLGKRVVLSEVNQSEKDKCHKTSLTCGTRSTKHMNKQNWNRPIDVELKLVGSRGEGAGALGETGEGIKKDKLVAAK